MEENNNIVLYPDYLKNNKNNFLWTKVMNTNTNLISPNKTLCCNENMSSLCADKNVRTCHHHTIKIVSS